MPQCAVMGWPGHTEQLFSGRAVANGENKIHHRRVRSGEFRPTLRAHAVGGVVEAPKHLEREGIDLSLGLTSGREGAKAHAPVFAHDRFRQNRTGAVSGAQEENVVDAFRHGPSSSASADYKA